MRCQRKILKIRWSQHVRNIDKRRKTNQLQLSNIIKKRRLQWFGHLQRMDASRLPLKLYRWTPYHGQRKPGRPRTAWKDVIRRDLDSCDGVDSGRDRSSCERPQDLGAFSTSASRCIDARCYLMIMMLKLVYPSFFNTLTILV